MFERIKAYKKLNKTDEFLKGVKMVAVITNDQEMLNDANESLYLNEVIRGKIMFSRKTARSYNLECIKKGF